MAQVTDPSITFVTGESGRETTEFVTALNTWEKDRRFVVSRVLKDEKDEVHFLGREDDQNPVAIQPLDLRQVAVTHWRDFEWVYTIQVGLLGAPLHQETFFAAGMQHGRDAGLTRHTRQFLDGWEGKLSGDRRRLSDGKIDIDYLGDPGGN